MDPKKINPGRPLSVPARLTLTRLVLPATISRRNTSLPPLVSLATRSLAKLVKSTYRPSSPIQASSEEKLLPRSVPARLTSTILVVPATTSRTYNAPRLALSSSKSDALLMKSTYRPSGVTAFAPEGPFPPPEPNMDVKTEAKRVADREHGGNILHAVC